MRLVAEAELETEPPAVCPRCGMDMTSDDKGRFCEACGYTPPEPELVGESLHWRHYA